MPNYYRCLRWLILLAAAFVPPAFAAPRSDIRAEVTHIVPRQTADTPCQPFQQGILKPANGATFYGSVDVNLYGQYVFEVLYCSGQYFKTRSLTATIGLAPPDQWASYGMILATPGLIEDAAGQSVAWLYAYYVNVTVYPVNGGRISGVHRLSVFEVSTGYYNPYSYEISYVDIEFVPTPPPNATNATLARS